MLRSLRRHPRLAIAFGLASLVALAFIGRLVFGLLYWQAHREEPIAGWMTVGYVGHSWGISPRAIDAAAGLPPPAGRPWTLQEIADARGVPVETVVAEVRAAVDRLRAAEGAGEAAPVPPPRDGGS
jgi:hypothetical protein